MRLRTQVEAVNIYSWYSVQGYRILARPMSTTVSDELLFGSSYHSAFDPEAYLKPRYSGDITDVVHCVFPLRQLHKFWASYPADRNDLKVLEFGTGPCILWEISSALFASEIVLAEYTASSRKLLHKWKNGDRDAHDWSPYFKYVVSNLEGKSEQEAKDREEKLRSVIKAIVACDALQESPIQLGYEGPYDVIITCLCLGPACATEEEYKSAVAKLSSLLKPGGRIVIYCTEGEKHFDLHLDSILSEKFRVLTESEELVTTSLTDAGFKNIVIEQTSLNNETLLSGSTETGLMFVVAEKH